MDDDDKLALKVVGFVILLFIIITVFGRSSCSGADAPPSCELGENYPN